MSEGTVIIAIEHNFETAHRLPFLGGKCTNLHGHSWKVQIFFQHTAFESGINAEGLSVDYSELKKVVREWIDDRLDHGCMLGAQDPLTPELLEMDSKVFVFGTIDHLRSIKMRNLQQYSYNLPPEYRIYPNLPWPTVEAVAQMLAERLQWEIEGAFAPYDIRINSLEVRETATNTALWIALVPSKEPSDRVEESEELRLMRERLQQG